MRVWDILPAGVTYVSGAEYYDPASRNASWTIDSIKAGYFTTITFVVKVTNAGDVVNTAFANSEDNKTVVNKTSDDIPVIPNVELEIIKVANVTEAVAFGIFCLLVSLMCPVLSIMTLLHAMLPGPLTVSGQVISYLLL